MLKLSAETQAILGKKLYKGMVKIDKQTKAAQIKREGK